MLSIRWSRYSESNWKLSFTRALLCHLTISANLRFSWLIFVNISLHKISDKAGAVFTIIMSSLYKCLSHFTIYPDVYILILLQIINPLKILFSVVFLMRYFPVVFLFWHSSCLKLWDSLEEVCFCRGSLILQGGVNCPYTVILLEFPLT